MTKSTRLNVGNLRDNLASIGCLLFADSDTNRFTIYLKLQTKFLNSHRQFAPGCDKKYRNRYRTIALLQNDINSELYQDKFELFRSSYLSKLVVHSEWVGNHITGIYKVASEH